MILFLLWFIPFILPYIIIYINLEKGSTLDDYMKELTFGYESPLIFVCCWIPIINWFITFIILYNHIKDIKIK